MGDFNLKLSKAKSAKYFGKYDLGTRNKRGDLLKELAE